MSLPRSKIEYLTHVWNFVRGCDSTPAQCPVREHCYARSMARRFKGGEFMPTFDENAFNAHFPVQEPARIGVCFTGELFGHTDAPIMWNRVLSKIENAPQHQFFLLTKRPENIPFIFDWPENAWVGVSVWDQESFDRALGYLGKIKANRWLSVEPMYGPIVPPDTVHIDWVVIGPQTQPMKLPAKSWVENLEAHIGLPVWEKQSLGVLMGRPLRHELPEGLKL